MNDVENKPDCLAICHNCVAKLAIEPSSLNHIVQELDNVLKNAPSQLGQNRCIGTLQSTLQLIAQCRNTMHISENDIVSAKNHPDTELPCGDLEQALLCDCPLHDVCIRSRLGTQQARFCNTEAEVKVWLAEFMLNVGGVHISENKRGDSKTA